MGITHEILGFFGVFPPNFQNNCSFFFHTCFFTGKLHTSTIGKIRINWLSTNSTFEEKSRNPWIFGSFFPQILRIIARFFANFYFHKKTLYLNDWQNRNKLIFPHFHFWGKLTKSSDFWEFFPPNFQNNYTFFCKLLFSHESSILYILAKSE